MDFKKVMYYNLDPKELGEWINEVVPDGIWEDGSFALMQFNKDGKQFQIQVKVTKNEDDFLDNPRIEL